MQVEDFNAGARSRIWSLASHWVKADAAHQINVASPIKRSPKDGQVWKPDQRGSSASGFTFGVHVEGRRDGLRRGVVSVGGGFLAVVGVAVVGVGVVWTEERLDGPISTNDVDNKALRRRMRAFILVDFEPWAWKSGMGSVMMWKCGDLCWVLKKNIGGQNTSWLQG